MSLNTDIIIQVGASLNKNNLWRVRIPFKKDYNGKISKLSVLIYPDKIYGDKYGSELIKEDKKAEEIK